jgi:dolichyl-phosphate-mannose--protein O-mannosyl transferase
MHFTQTRIATVDTYGVFFIMLSFLFMYRFIATEATAPFKKQLLPLALSGITFGLGASSKWIVLYAGVALLVMYVLRLATDYKYYYAGETTRKRAERAKSAFQKRLFKILAFSVLFFLVIPGIFYVVSYVPFGHGRGMTVKGGMLWDPEYYKLLWQVNKGMYSYHSTLVTTTPHPYASDWWQWVLDARPMLYYLNYSVGDGVKSAFSAFGNPLVWWGGIGGILIMFYHAIKDRDSKAQIILVNFAVQLVPWIIIKREVYVYHYFASTIFLMLSLCYIFSKFIDRDAVRGRRWTVGITAAAGVLFAMFYPVISGVIVSQKYAQYVLKWFPRWPV